MTLCCFVLQDCVITIDATLPQYHKNAFGAVAVTVRDYNRNPLKFATKNYPSYMFSLGDVAAQVICYLAFFNFSSFIQ